MDDDNYLNPEALLSLLSRFPQDGDVYVGRPSLDRPITAHELMEGNKTVSSPAPVPPTAVGEVSVENKNHLSIQTALINGSPPTVWNFSVDF